MAIIPMECTVSAEGQMPLAPSKEQAQALLKQKIAELQEKLEQLKELQKKLK